MRYPNLRVMTVVTVMACTMLAPSHPLKAEELEKVVTQGVATSERVAESNTGKKGVATYYAARYKGRRTSSGERYNPAKLTAAHNDLPLGTKVKVTNLENDCEVIVTINDRCKKRKTRLIDLSRTAAKELGFLRQGKARVLITSLEEEKISIN
jgi:rare lipoprotein A